MLLGVEPIGVYAYTQLPDDPFQGVTEIICVHWEDRAMSVSFENRAMIVLAEDKNMAVLFEARTDAAEVKKEIVSTAMAVPFEDRAMTAGSRKRVC